MIKCFVWNVAYMRLRLGLSVKQTGTGQKPSKFGSGEGYVKDQLEDSNNALAQENADEEISMWNTIWQRITNY